MKHLDLPNMDTAEDENKFYASVETADFPDDMLESFDRLLRKHGLELGLYDDGTADYVFTIVTGS